MEPESAAGKEDRESSDERHTSMEPESAAGKEDRESSDERHTSIKSQNLHTTSLLCYVLQILCMLPKGHSHN